MKKYTTFFLLVLLFATNLKASNQAQLPSIQEAWVDSGFFTWNDSTKTSLKITELGAKQDTLPDVCDGEQLTDASFMFSGSERLEKFLLEDSSFDIFLKKIPEFNTKNIESFEGIFAYCSELETIPLLNTSQVTDFSMMCVGCDSLKQIPFFDTSKGTDFTAMFYACSSLTFVPDFDLSQGRDFSVMFYGCKELTIKPKLIISKYANTTSIYLGTPFKNN